jgi:hypothetical protein
MQGHGRELLAAVAAQLEQFSDLFAVAGQEVAALTPSQARRTQILSGGDDRGTFLAVITQPI